MAENQLQEKAGPFDKAGRVIGEAAITAAEFASPVTAAIGEAGQTAGAFDIDEGFRTGASKQYGPTLSPKGTLEESMRESMEAQAGEVDYDTFIGQIQRGEVAGVGLLKPEDLTRIADVATNQNIPESTRTAASQRLQRVLVGYNRERTQPKAITAYGGERFQPTAEARKDMDLYSAQEAQWESERSIYNIVHGQFDNMNLPPDETAAVEQAIIDSVSTNSFFDMAQESLYQNSYRDPLLFVGDVINYGSEIIASGTEYLARGFGSLAFGDRVDYQTFKRIWDDGAESRETFKKTWNKVMSDGLGAETTKNVLNGIIRQRLSTQFADQPEKLNKLLNSPVVGADGQPIIGTDGTPIQVQREFVNDQQAAQIVTGAVNTLSDLEQWSLALFDSAVMIAGAGKAKVATGFKQLGEGRDEVRRVIKEGTNDAGEVTGALAKQLVKMTEIQQIRFLASKNKKMKFNESAVFNALEVEKADAGFKRLTDGIKDAKNEISNRKNLDGSVITDVEEAKKLNVRVGETYRFASDAGIDALRTKQKSLTRQFYQAKITLRGMPVLRSSLFEAGGLAAAQYFSGEYLTEMFGGDRFAAQGIGALGYMFGGKQLLKGIGKGLQWANLRVGDPVGSFALTLENSANVVSSLITLGKLDDFFTGTITDRDLIDYERLIESTRFDNAGSPIKLTYEERRSIRYLRKLAGSMNDESREMVRDSLEEYATLQDKIVSAAKPEDRQRVSKLFSESFATMSGIGWMKAASQLSIGKISAAAAANPKHVNDGLAAQLASQNMIMQQKEGLKQLKEYVSKVTDPEDKTQLQNYIDMLETSIIKADEQLIKDNAATSRAIDDALEIMLQDTFTKVDHNAIKQHIDLSVDAQAILNPTINKIAARNRLTVKRDKLLAERIDTIKKDRMTPTHAAKTGRMIEAALLNVVDDAKELARSGFENLDAKALKANKTINVGDMILDMFKYIKDDNDVANVVGTDRLARFFSEDSTFFDGSMGRKVQTVFNNMARRYFNSLPEGVYERLVKQYTSPKTDAGEDNPLYIGKDTITPLELGMIFAEKGDFKAFEALPGEVMDVYAAFRDYSVKIKDKAPTLARNYKNYAGNVRKLVKEQASEYFDEWQEAALLYKREWFDRFERSGGPISKVTKSQKHGRLTTKIEKTEDELDNRVDVEAIESDESLTPFADLFVYGYSGVTPDTTFSPMISKVQKAMSRKGTAQDILALGTDIRKLLMEIGGRDVNGEIVIDVADEKSYQNFVVLQKALTELMYDKWGRTVVDKLNTVGKPTGGLPSYKKDVALRRSRDITQKGGYDFDLSEFDNLEDVQEAFQVKFINVGGRAGDTAVRSMVDLEKMISETRELTDHLAKDSRTQDELAALGNKLKRDMQSVKGEITATRKIDTLGMNALRQAANISDGRTFLKKFVIESDGKALARVKIQMRRILQEGDETKTTISIELPDGQLEEMNIDEVVNQALGKLAIDGVMDMAGTRVAKGRVLGQKVGETVREMPRMNDVVDLLDNAQNRDILVDLLGDESVTYLQDLTNYLNKKIDTLESIDADTTIQGMVRPFSINQLISRAFNIRRGMVSPQYVAAELAVSIASTAGIDLLKLASTDPNTGRIMVRFLEYPKEMTSADLKTLQDGILGFLARELSTGRTVAGAEVVEGLVSSLLDETEGLSDEEKQSIMDKITPNVSGE